MHCYICTCSKCEWETLILHLVAGVLKVAKSLSLGMSKLGEGTWGKACLCLYVWCIYLFLCKWFHFRLGLEDWFVCICGARIHISVYVYIYILFPSFRNKTTTKNPRGSCLGFCLSSSFLHLDIFLLFIHSFYNLLSSSLSNKAGFARVCLW